KGRWPIKTELVGALGRKRACELVREEIKKGKQAYIVYPLIDESETISAKNATQEAKRLAQGEFSNYKIGLLHGKLKNTEKEQVMADFKNKKYDILVSTTVVEVGVDVPNSTVMIIENAERFGLAQLHQLRGRVGRSSEQSYCVLVSMSASVQVKQRLSIMTQTNNGFTVAEKDLEIRGPGEFLGTRQSGIADLGLSDLVNDVKILDLAREEAFLFVKNEDISAHPGLLKLTAKHTGLLSS
ncbi:ATP-dependent DNA helicase RecG, partial [Candidatus Gastranaerophilus sp. (ex Termes propinquus)]